MGDITKILKSADAFMVEKNNKSLAEYLNTKLHEYLQLTLPKKVSFLEKLKG